MKIFSAEQFRRWDEHTIRNERISSTDLMERAAHTCFNHIINAFPNSSFVIFAGPGNNGGDGVAIARLLKDAGRTVQLFHPGEESISEDNRHNLRRWTSGGGVISDFLLFDPSSLAGDQVIIDALFGTGQNRPVVGKYKELILKINSCKATKISVDLPSGLHADKSSLDYTVVKADITLSFQLMKLCFLVPENADHVGEVRLLDIGLNKAYYDDTETQYYFTTSEDVREMIVPRIKFSHKGTYGTAILFAGKKGMMGAAILAAGGCLRSGVGKLVCRIPGAGLDIMQVTVPEAICFPDLNLELLEHMPELAAYQSIGIGPGIGTAYPTKTLVDKLLDVTPIPMVIDADALNIIAEEKWQDRLKPGSVITPHPGEFKRLFGNFDSDFSKMAFCLELSTAKQICIILKGHYSFLSTPGGKGYFNPTGNPGMAKAGMGDVLTGMITSFLAQKYSVDKACRLSLYLHGKAGDLAESTFGQASFVASDVIKQLGKAFAGLV